MRVMIRRIEIRIIAYARRQFQCHVLLRMKNVFTQPGIQLAGQRVAEGTAARLVLWHIGGPVRVVGATSNEQLSQKACP